jgi:hypothetical protein
MASGFMLDSDDLNEALDAIASDHICKPIDKTKFAYTFISEKG